MITKCLFPAAGYGTRFLPATKAVPKENYLNSLHAKHITS